MQVERRAQSSIFARRPHLKRPFLPIVPHITHLGPTNNKSSYTLLPCSCSECNITLKTSITNIKTINVKRDLSITKCPDIYSSLTIFLSARSMKMCTCFNFIYKLRCQYYTVLFCSHFSLISKNLKRNVTKNTKEFTLSFISFCNCRKDENTVKEFGLIADIFCGPRHPCNRIRGIFKQRLERECEK